MSNKSCSYLLVLELYYIHYQDILEQYPVHLLILLLIMCRCTLFYQGEISFKYLSFPFSYDNYFLLLKIKIQPFLLIINIMRRSCIQQTSMIWTYKFYVSSLCTNFTICRCKCKIFTLSPHTN